MSYNPRLDPELEFLKDRELIDIARVLASRKLAKPPLDPAFQSSLRRQLRKQHWELLETSQPWWRRLRGGPALAWSASAVGAIMIAAAVLFLAHPPGSNGVLVVSSPLAGLHDVAVVQPMRIEFAQPMDHTSVESALTIQPATTVTYDWQGNTLLVQPAAGQLAPNTQYRLTLAQSATSSTGTHLDKPATIVFVTAAPAPPVPLASPSPSPGIAIGTPTELAPATGGVPLAWSADGSTIYFAGPDDSPQSVSIAGGTPKSLGPQAVSQIALSPDGATVAVASASSILLLPTTPTPGVSAPPANLNPLAMAWDGPKLLAAVAAGVVEVKPDAEPKPSPTFAATAREAAFAPNGKAVLYRDSKGTVHLVDIASGKDTPWTSSTAGLPAWSQDGTEVAFLTPQGVETAAPDGSGAAALASLDQLAVKNVDGITLAWSGGSVLASTPSGLTGIDTSARVPVQLASGAFTALSASPDRQGVAYVQNGQLYTVVLQRPGTQDQLLAKAKAQVGAFMEARKAGDGSSAAKYLDAAGTAAFAKTTLLYSGQPHLARWFPVFTQAHSDGTATAVVRLVLADEKGIEQSQLDETLTLLQGADGSVLVHGTGATAPRPVDGGPEVVSLDATAGQLTIQFDSDLDPATLASIALTGAGGTPAGAAPTYAKQVVTINLSSIAPGTLLRLTIPTTLKDVHGRGVAETLTLPIVVPSSVS